MQEKVKNNKSRKLIKASESVPDFLNALATEKARRGRPTKEVTLQAVSARIEPEILEAIDKLHIKRNALINTLLRQHLESIGAI